MNDASPFTATRLSWTAWLATGCGLGMAPVAPGTFGTLPGILLVGAVRYGIFTAQLTGWVAIALEAAAALVWILIAIPLCDRAEGFFGRKDDGRIVADEFATFPLAMLGLPFSPWLIVVAFLSHRFFDILKPPPARGLQRLRGGFGIVVDDVIASLYALAFNHLVLFVVTRYGAGL